MIRQREFNPLVHVNTMAYVMQNDTVCRRCNRCGSVVLDEPDSKEYPYQCMNCDEDLYRHETHIGEPHTDDEFEELCEDTFALLCLDD